MLSKVYIVLLVLFLQGMACPATVLSYQIAAEIIDIVPTSPTQTLFTYSYLTSFSSVPQTTIGISSMSITRIDNRMPYAVYAIPTPSTTMLQIRASPAQGLWTVRQITVLATLQPELLLDTVTAQLWSGSSQVQSQNVVFKLSENNKLETQQNIIVRTFLAGISTPTGLSYLLLADAWLQQDQVFVSVTTKEQGSAQLWISVVAFPAKSLAFSVYGGTASIEKENVSHYDLFKSMAAPQNPFYGINGVSLGSSSPQNTEITAAIDHNFILTLSKTGASSSFQLSYLFVGLSGEQICLNCMIKGLGNAYTNGSCSLFCPPNTVAIPMGNSFFCRYCPSSMGLGFQNNQCVTCPPATIAKDGLCLQSSAQPDWTQPSIPQSVIDQLFKDKSGSAASGGQSGSGGGSGGCVFANMFWNGEECTCLVGYALINNICIPISIAPSFFVPQNTNNPFNGQNLIQNSTSITNSTNTSSQSNQTSGGQVKIITCSDPNQYFNGLACVCKPGFALIDNLCRACPDNSRWNGQTCQCLPNYYSLNGLCQPISTNCPFGSVNNGLGVCVCQQPGYTLINSMCTSSQCSSGKQWNGTACVCPAPYLLSRSGACQPPCPPGTLYSSSTSTCLTPCGLNSVLDALLQTCRCVDGFALGSNNQCIVCPDQYYIYGGYCVRCPLNAQRSIYGTCQCLPGFVTNIDGLCLPKCSSLETYSSATGSCECRVGLVRNTGTGQCQFCPSGSSQFNGQCIKCPLNSVLMNGKCVCVSGFIRSGSVCVQCWQFPNAFEQEGKCALCLDGQHYNLATGQCECSQGFALQGRSCVSNCVGGELTLGGFCSSCPLNMVSSNGACICANGYSFNGCECELKCEGSQFMFQGRCAQCPLNMVYSAVLQGCFCPSNYYFSAVLGVCVPFPDLPTNCPIGQSYSNVTKTCRICSLHCLSCDQNYTCWNCETGYHVQFLSGKCLADCGDGVTLDGQQCDTGSRYDPGCQKCLVVPGYQCVGRPSVCSAVTPTPTPTPVTPPQQESTLSLLVNPSISTNNVFLSLRTTPTFTFPDDSTMKQFIKASFPNTVQPTVYCLQRAAPNLDLFDCLLIYPSGVPNQQFTIDFRFSYQGRSASVRVVVNPFNYTPGVNRG